MVAWVLQMTASLSLLLEMAVQMLALVTTEKPSPLFQLQVALATTETSFQLQAASVH